MKIYNKNNTEIHDIAVDDSSVRYRSIMTDDSLTLNFSLTGAIAIPQFSYVNFEGHRYTLWRPSEFKKHNTRNHEYTLTLHGYREFLKFVKYKDTSAKPYRLKFSLTAKPSVFLKQLVDCLNLKDSGWTVGDCIDAPEKTLSFNHEFCIDVLGRMAQEWNTEFEFEGKKVHFRKVEKFKDAPLALSYGKGNGFLPGVGRYNEGDKQPIGALHVIGGERNIDFSKYGSRSLLLPKSATLVYEGKTYRTDADGMFITRDGNNLVGEDSYDGAHFYPHRVGSVSEVIVVDAEKHFYDIKDASIPETLNYRDCRIAGEKAVIKFESGALAGREFDVEQTENDLTGYIHAERRFKIVPAEIDGVVMPGGAFVPAVGDKYAIFNINLPQSYISDDATKTGASWEMFREAVRYFAENETDKFRFTGELDGVWSKSRWLEIGGKIVPGGHVLFSDEQFQPQGVVIRIVAVKDYVNKPHKPEITLSNAPISGSFSSGLTKLEADEVVIEESKKEVLRFSKRQWRDARETMELLEKTMLNFSGSINPLTVQTMQLIAGDESLQFRFVNNKINPVRVRHSIQWNKTDKTLTAAEGILQHMTLGITTLTSARKPSDYRYWDMAAYNSPSLNADKAYYMYAKCSRAGTTGTFILSETAIGMLAEAEHLHFLVGILNSENGGDRSFAPLYGYTEILPGRVTTDKIVSSDGLTYFDLINGVIGGKIRFTSTGGDDTSLADWADGTSQDVQDAQAAANAAALAAQQAIDDAAANVGLINNEVGKLQARIADAKQAGLDAQTALGETNTTVNALNAEWGNATKDGIISQAETQSLDVLKKKIIDSRDSALAEYNRVYTNTYLEGTAKTNLLNSKTTFAGAVDALLTSLTNAISDGKTTVAEKTDVNNKFNSYNSASTDLSDKLSLAQIAIEGKLKGYSDAALQAANNAQTSANNAQNSANTANQAVGNLNTYVDGAFKDGVIDGAEAKAIEKYINVVNSEKAGLEATYNKLYTNAYLDGTAKTNLLNAKVTYFGSVDNLLSAINSAIADGKTTVAEKNNVDAKYNEYRTTHASLQSAIEEANKAIQAKIDQLSTDKVNNLQIGGVNLLASSKKQKSGTSYNIGYWSSIRDFVIGEELTVTIKGNIPGSKLFGLWFNSGSIGSGSIPKLKEGYYQKKLSVPVGTTSRNVGLYLVGNQSAADSWEFEWIKLESGDKVTLEWSAPTEDVQARIDAEKTRINEMLSDNIADPSEKQYLSNLWQEIYAEYPRYWNQAHSHGVSYTDYANKYTALNNLLSPVLANLNVNTSVSGASIRTAFNQYYDTRAVLVNAVTNKVNAAAEGAMEKATEADYLKAALSNKTRIGGVEFDSGLVLTSLVAAQDSSDRVRSYMNGDPDLNPTAFAAGVESFGTLGETKNVDLRHDGTGNIGVFAVEKQGRVLILDPSTGNARLVFDAMNIPTAADLVNNVSFSGSANIGSGSTSSSTVLPGSTNVTKDNAKAVFSGVTVGISAGGQIQPSGMSSYAAATLYARRNGVRALTLASAMIMFTEENNVIKYETVDRSAFNIPAIQAGNYTFELAIEKGGAISSANADVTTSVFSWEFVTQGIRQQQYGLDGMMFFYSDNHFHFTENGGLDLRGKTNMPGVLATGSSTSGGTHTRQWGAKANANSSVTPISGGFRVPLKDLNHNNYTVLITPHTNTTFRIGTRTNTYFEIYGTGGFDYVVIGKNYA